jgi:calcium/calmodulin-dependent protein kinase I
LKPENVLFKTPDRDSPLVIADFGIAKHLEYDPPESEAAGGGGSNLARADGAGEGEGEGQGEKREGGVTSVAGSFGYAAPEVLAGKRHGVKVDCWSIGYVSSYS